MQNQNYAKYELSENKLSEKLVRIFLKVARKVGSMLPKKIRTKLHEEFTAIVAPHSLDPILGKPFISNGKLDICIVNNAKTPYFAVLNSQQTDNIANFLRTNTSVPIAIDPRLVDMLPPEGTYLDLGANIGSVSLFFAANGWQCFAFEASPQNADLIRKSIMLNDYNIKLFGKAVSDHTGSLFFVSREQFGFVVTDIMEGLTVQEGYGNQIDEIPCIALDDMLENELSQIGKIDFIKIDIEGSEVAALRGMKNLLNHYGYPPIYMEVNAWTLFLLNETPLSLIENATSLGYTAYIIEDTNILSIYPNDMFPIYTNQDVLLLKELPDNITVISKDYPDDKKIIEWIQDKIHRRESWAHYVHYIFYALKDFPQYYNEPTINKELQEISVANNNHVLTNKALEWFRAL